MRVLLTGMGGQLGTSVARLLEARSDVDSIVGYDMDPPRRHLNRAVFHRINPRSTRRVAEVVREADPEVVLHLGVYEPHARLAPADAQTATVAGARALVAALGNCDHLDHLVMRSGIEVYGRSRSGPVRPDESVVPAPTSAFGRALLEVENRLSSVEVSQSVLRCAPVVGSHVPSPLGRLLKMPAIPLNALSDPPFTLLHATDAAAAIVAAIDRRPDGIVNVVADGVVTPTQVACIGRRIPVAVFGPGWRIAGFGSSMVSSPLPDHVRELLVRGRVADGGRAEKMLGSTPVHSTRDIVTELYRQSNVVFLPVDPSAAA